MIAELNTNYYSLLKYIYLKCNIYKNFHFFHKKQIFQVLLHLQGFCLKPEVNYINKPAGFSIFMNVKSSVKNCTHSSSFLMRILRININFLQKLWWHVSLPLSLIFLTNRNMDKIQSTSLTQHKMNNFLEPFNLSPHHGVRAACFSDCQLAFHTLNRAQNYYTTRGESRED